jgi:hypothetical protein
MSTVDECLNAGCDPEAWVNNGWIDYLVMGDYNYSCLGLKVESFAAFCKGKCELYTQMGDMAGGCWKDAPKVTGRSSAMSPGKEGYYGMLLNNHEARAIANNHYHWGTDGIAFWNICCHIGTRGKGTGPEYRGRMFEWMNSVIYPERCRTESRTYHYVPFYKGFGKFKGIKNYAVAEEFCSPMGAVRGKTVELTTIEERSIFDFRMADGVDGTPVNGKLRFRIMNWSEASELQADINGKDLTLDLLPDPDITGKHHLER